ncbi:MAG TPA: DapH/DapD/GlmU-related protein [Methanoregulaceae archaeon]|nr:DapH/DapD/GlmU-related protein [Methanoregulaceae archaeon]HQJ87487.1 DapH/DapD/GlmU-related protein [Methanoregulaceae archaeon]
MSQERESASVPHMTRRKGVPTAPRSWKQRLFQLSVFGFRAVAGLFFDRQRLVGIYFDDSTTGWKWVLRGLLFQKLLGFNRNIPWPVSPLNTISVPYNIEFDPDDINMFNEMSGKYFQNFAAPIRIGKGTWIASNVGIITANHDPDDLKRHLPGREVVIGEGCWIGMNAVILPGVHLGPRTIVGAGAIVTRSFPEGHCVIVGNPARVVRYLPRAQADGGVAPK